MSIITRANLSFNSLGGGDSIVGAQSYQRTVHVSGALTDGDVDLVTLYSNTLAASDVAITCFLNAQVQVSGHRYIATLNNGVLRLLDKFPLAPGQYITVNSTAGPSTWQINGYVHQLRASNTTPTLGSTQAYLGGFSSFSGSNTNIIPWIVAFDYTSETSYRISAVLDETRGRCMGASKTGAGYFIGGAPHAGVNANNTSGFLWTNSNYQALNAKKLTFSGETISNVSGGALATPRINSAVTQSSVSNTATISGGFTTGTVVSNVVEKFDMGGETVSAYGASLAANRYSIGNAGASYYTGDVGFIFGGSFNGPPLDTIIKISHSSASISTIAAVINSARKGNSVVQQTDHAYIKHGANATDPSNSTQRFIFSSETMSTLTLQTALHHWGGGGRSSTSTTGYFYGDSPGFSVSTINSKMNFSTGVITFCAAPLACYGTGSDDTNSIAVVTE